MSLKRTSLLPSIPQVILYWFLGLAAVIASSYTVILDFLGGETLEEVGGIDFLIQGRDYYLDYVFGIPVLGTITVILFWASIGCGLYCLVWFLSNSAKEAKKYNEASGYVKPKGYNAQTFWGTSISEIALFLTSIVMIIVLLIVIFAVFMPANQSLLLIVLGGESIGQIFYAVAVFLLGWLILCHILFLAVHIFNYSRKVVFF